MSGHTPGPWAIYEEEIGGSYQIYPAGKFLDPWIADAKGTHVGPSNHAEVIANAHLIAAAPDLLLAVKCLCEEMADYMQINKLGDPNDKHNYRLGMAAIVRAEGNPS